MKKAAKITVQGTVQGVFFRQYIKNYADKLELKGHVRNLETGEVEILIEGEQEDIQEMTQYIKTGPKHSHIRNVKVEEKKWSGEQKEFKILKF